MDTFAQQTRTGSPEQQVQAKPKLQKQETRGEISNLQFGLLANTFAVC